MKTRADKNDSEAILVFGASSTVVSAFQKRWGFLENFVFADRGSGFPEKILFLTARG